MPYRTAEKLKVVHIITGLPVGGAQTMLSYLLEHNDPAHFEMSVISLGDIGPVGQRLREKGVDVRALNMSRRLPNPIQLLGLARRLRSQRAMLVQSWLYHADLVGGLAARLGGRIPVIWNIRQSDLDPRLSKRKTIWTANACAKLSKHLPLKIVCCSEASRSVHTRIGYYESKMVVIPNCVDTNLYRPDDSAGTRVRQELGLDTSTPLIGLVARFHPQKDHYNFLRAAAMLHRVRPDVHFLMCGEDITPNNVQLMEWIATLGIDRNVHLLGRRDDIPNITAALDVATSASAYGEGFSNALVEALACGVPCVTTDVGDSSIIVGSREKVVAPNDPEALAAACANVLGESGEVRRSDRLRRRSRAKRKFGLKLCIDRYQNLYRKVANETYHFTA